MADRLSPRLRIAIVTPAPRGSRTGNRTTALRTAGLLRQLGHRVCIETAWRGKPIDVLLALHAERSADAVFACASEQPTARIVLMLTGTDLYTDLNTTHSAVRQCLGERATRAAERADVLVALHGLVAAAMPDALRHQTRTIVQSATAVPTPRAEPFTAVLLAHLRPVKQPLLAIQALASVPTSVPMQLVLAGSRLDDDYSDEVARAIAATPRARYVGELTRRRSKQLLASSQLCLVPSSSEGGANVVSEAIAAGTPVLCSDVPGNLGLLGADWPGKFAAGDAAALGALLTRCARDAGFLDELCRRTIALQPMVAPARERDDWRRLLADLNIAVPPSRH